MGSGLGGFKGRYGVGSKGRGGKMANAVSTKLWKSFDWALCKTAGVTFDTIQFFNKYNPNPSFTPKWSDKPLLKSWEKSKPTLGWPRHDRFAVPGLRERSARVDLQRQERLERSDAREGRRDQGADHRARRPGLDGEGMPDPRQVRRHDGHRLASSWTGSRRISPAATFPRTTTKTCTSTDPARCATAAARC